MGQLHACCKHVSNLQEHADYASGNIISAIYNVNRDTRKHGVLDWWQFMPRWAAKFKLREQMAQEESLKAYLIALSKSQTDQVQ